MILFTVETFAQFYPDAKEIMPQHWAELAVDQDKIKLGLDVEKYEGMQQAGILHILTVRKNARLIGYYVAFVLPHIHYKEAGLMAFTDIYFLLPAYRKGPCGAQLFIEAEKTLKQRGVTKAYLSCKVHQDHTALFEALGWKLTDKSFTKYLG